MREVLTPTNTHLFNLIGKTLCLIYLLVLRLLAKEPVALQINSQEFVLFDHHGVSIHPAVTGHVPEGAWALSDSSPDRHGPCKAFEASYSHLIHMSSPTSCDWKSWAEDLNSSMFFMDVLSLEEFQVLLYVVLPTTIISLTDLYQHYQ